MNVRNLLAINTTADALSLALKSGEDILTLERSCRLGQDEILIPSVEKILKKAGLVLKNLDAIAVASGPGRFTGIRVGMAYAAVAAAQMGIPAVAVSRLEAIAFKSCAERLCAVAPGFREEKFHQLFQRSGGVPLPAGEPAWLRRPEWEKSFRDLQKGGWVLVEFPIRARDLLEPALFHLSAKKLPKFEPLYLKPAGYEAKR
ncbi:MAG: tRNA (adenosine(37)-N6)-threonylcarbamoyltransferase complex dimerization subunit type 1 TsaB [Elusimicrobia bacterium]|nr:tRNA (adenosine(37)-N6)-threonylcarbamoyltransferase complex dimerization subunit type 1 TsaB [Elusimicrobiota bacterium]